MIFWLIFACLTAGVAAGLLPVALHARTPGAPSKTEPPSEEAPSLVVYREQLAQLAREVERGAIAESEAGAFRNEIGRRLIKAADRPADRAAGLTPRGRVLVAGSVLVALPLAALGLYLRLGQPDLPDQPYGARGPERAAAAADEARRAEVIKLVDQLGQRMKDNPDDPRGWRCSADRFPSSATIRRAPTPMARRSFTAPACRKSTRRAASPSPRPRMARSARARRPSSGARSPPIPRSPRRGSIWAWPGFRRRCQRGAGRLAGAARRRAPADAPWQPMPADHIAAAAKELGVDAKAP